MNEVIDQITLFCTGAIVIAVACALLVGGWKAVRAVLLFDYELQQRRIEVQRMAADAKLVVVTAGMVKMERNEVSAYVPDQIRLMAADIATRLLPQPVPHSLTFSPHYSSRGEPAAQLVEPEQTLASIKVPSFREMFHAGMIRKDQLMLGCHRETGTPHYGNMKDVYSSLIIAKSGGGKTTLERFLVGQAINMGAKVGIIDPHGHSNDGLVAALRPLQAHQLFAPAIDDKEIERTMHYFMQLVQDRTNQVDTSTDVRILAIDEVNMLIDDFGDDFAKDLARIAERGRKWNVFVFAAGQSAEASRTGGSAAMRKAFVGRYVLRADKDAVQRLIPDRKLLDTVPLLQPGQSIFVPTRSEPVPLIIPDTTSADLAACFGSQVVEPVPPPVTRSVPQSVPQLIHEPQSWVDVEPATSQAALVRQMYKAGKSQTEIIAEVWGIRQKGRAWQQASQELNEVLRSLIP